MAERSCSPVVADLAPSDRQITDYDRSHLATYARLLDADPDLTAADTNIWWRPEIDPNVLCLTSGPFTPDDRRVAAEPGRWRGTVAVVRPRVGRGCYAILQVGAGKYRLWLAEAGSQPATGVWLPVDRFFAERANLAVEFWRAAADPPVSAAPARATTIVPYPFRIAQLRVLRALDGRLAGASYRDIAGILLGVAAAGDARTWKTVSARSAVIRLVKKGLRLINGGYRGLLLPIKRRPRRQTGGQPTGGQP